MIETAIPRSSLFTEVVSRLRQEIVEGVWRPGARLQERILCARFNISRSPLREAYQVLAAEGLLETSLNRGVVVSAPSPRRILENFVLLRTLEVLAVELACEHATADDLQRIFDAEAAMKQAGLAGKESAFLHANNEVHRLIVVASRNQPLIDAHTVVSRQLIRVQNLNGPLEHSLDESIDEHDQFLTALAARDKSAAAQRFDRHLTTVEDNLRRRLEPFAEEGDAAGAGPQETAPPPTR
ncbi:GntR family transcriptional regulator [Caulobacter soli]|uniref:GntR family transcriptional regulator n=1 Tax=Caulobacter soli TaxID=2708539 RepID=UPI0013ED98FB|nr:GntR family transcriptional regulator [Caulobacter soli]